MFFLKPLIHLRFNESNIQRTMHSILNFQDLFFRMNGIRKTDDLSFQMGFQHLSKAKLQQYRNHCYRHIHHEWQMNIYGNQDQFVIRNRSLYLMFLITFCLLLQLFHILQSIMTNLQDRHFQIRILIIRQYRFDLGKTIVYNRPS